MRVDALLEWVRVAIDRLRGLVHRDALEREMEAEMRFHLEMEIAERMRSGMTATEARRTALRDFGGVERYKEEVRGVRRAIWLEDLGRQARLSLRSLRRSPAFSVVVVTLLALGVGAGAAVYALVDATLLRPVPYYDPASLLVIWNRRADAPFERVPVAAPHVARVRQGVAGLRAVAFTNRVLDVTIGSNHGPAHARLGLVTPNFFDVLGVAMAAGRGFTASDAVAADGQRRELGTAVVLSHGIWRNRFGGDPDIVGRSVSIEGRPLRVVGVLPATFRVALPPDVGLPERVDVWAPLGVELHAYRRPDRLRDRDSDNSGLALARMAEGVTTTEIGERLAALSRALAEYDVGYREANLVLDASTLRQALTWRSRPLLQTLALAGVLLLLAIGVSVAGLVLARHSRRQRELGTRAALGAGPTRLFGEQLVESLLVVLSGSAVGLALAWVAAQALRGAHLPGLVGTEAIELTPGVLLVAAVISLAFLALLAGLPGLQMLRSGVAERAQPDRLRSGGRLRARTALVVAQVALAFLLLAGSTVLVRRLAELRATPLGFQAAGALAFDLSLRYADAFDGPAARARYVRNLENALRELPSVSEVGLVGRLPLSGRSWMQPYGPPDTQPAAWNEEANFRVVTSGFLSAAGTRLLAGRGFTPQEDLYEERRVVMVDEGLARRLARSPRDVVGRRISFPLDGAPVTAQVVGVIESVRFDGLDGSARPTIYVPYRQEASREISLVLRGPGEPAALSGAVREAVRALGIPLAPYNLRPLQAYVRDRLAPSRLTLDLVAAFALLTLIAALVGVYGLAIYSAGARRKEMAVRMALGATSGDILLTFMRWGGLIALGGLGLGALLLLSARPVLAAAVAGLAGPDLALVSGAAGLLALMVLMACAWGGRSAVLTQPSQSLRLDA